MSKTNQKTNIKKKASATTIRSASNKKNDVNKRNTKII